MMCDYIHPLFIYKHKKDQAIHVSQTDANRRLWFNNFYLVPLRHVIPGQIAAEFTHLQTLTLLFDNQNWNARNDGVTPVLTLCTCPISSFFFILSRRKVFSHSAQCFYCPHTYSFVVSLWCGDMNMYSSFQFSDIILSHWDQCVPYYKLMCWISYSEVVLLSRDLNLFSPKSYFYKMKMAKSYSRL